MILALRPLLKIGSAIAVSILAELIAVRRGVDPRAVGSMKVDLPGRLAPRPGHADPAVVPVAAGFFLRAYRPGLGPAQARDRAAVAGLGEQPVDLAPGRGVVGGADHAGDLGGRLSVELGREQVGAELCS